MSQDIDITNTLLQALIEDKPFDIHIPDPLIKFFLKKQVYFAKIKFTYFQCRWLNGMYGIEFIQTTTHLRILGTKTGGSAFVTSQLRDKGCLGVFVFCLFQCHNDWHVS